MALALSLVAHVDQLRLLGYLCGTCVFFIVGSSIQLPMTMTSSPLTGMAIAAALMLAACADNAEPKPADLPAVPATSEVGLAAPVVDMVMEAEAPASVLLNPAHGEPGHRCEIPVGAPLDGSGQASNTATMPPPAPTVVSPVADPMMAAPVTSPVAGGSGRLNPAHGEPGHDCAVPVGSPLPG